VEETAEVSGFSAKRLQQARAIVGHSRELAAAIRGYRV
jgi:hypothetical protein